MNEKGDISIVAVDGRKGEFDQYIAVKPGKHTLAVNLQSCGIIFNPQYGCNLILSEILSFEVSAGRTYLVGGSASLRGIWIEEEETLVKRIHDN